jgi:hypothetical protein
MFDTVEPCEILVISLSRNVTEMTCWSRTKRTSLSSHQNETCSCHGVAETLLIWFETTITH